MHCITSDLNFATSTPAAANSLKLCTPSPLIPDQSISHTRTQSTHNSFRLESCQQYALPHEWHRRIENENKHIDRRLDSISKQTSGSQHTTLEHGNLQRKVQRTSNTGVAVGALDVNLPPRIQFVASEAGQPWSTSSSMLARVRHAREVQQSNAVLQGKLLSR